MQATLGSAPQASLREFHRAIVLDPASAYNWANLGDAELNAGSVSMAEYCYQQAVSAAPLNPVISFRAANFAFANGDARSTLLRLRSILQDPELAPYYEPAFLTYGRLSLPIQQILDNGIPKNGPAAGAFLHFLMEEKKVPQSEAVWDWIQQNLTSDDKLTGDYLAFLIREKLPEKAALVWQKFTVPAFPEYRKTNWVYDGGFTKAPTLSPLDWKWETTGDVVITRLAGAGHQGGWALQAQFSGKENIDFRQVSQTLVLSPGKWSLRAWLRTEGITTDSGLTLHLFDPVNRQRLDFATPQMRGTNGWTLQNTDFEVHPGTSLVMLEFARSPSRKFDNKIAGTAWLDAVEVRPN